MFPIKNPMGLSVFYACARLPQTYSNTYSSVNDGVTLRDDEIAVSIELKLAREKSTSCLCVH